MEIKDQQTWVKLTLDPLSPREIEEWCTLESIGSIVHFHGTTRNSFEGKQVTHLEYESDEELALQQLHDICQEALTKFCQVSTMRIAMHHRLGRVNVKETSILCCVSSSHRKEGFEACEFMMHDLKANVAVWKKEFFDDGDSVWKENKEQFENKPKD